jgi:hypothetical protein
MMFWRGAASTMRKNHRQHIHLNTKLSKSKHFLHYLFMCLTANTYQLSVKNTKQFYALAFFHTKVALLV